MNCQVCDQPNASFTGSSKEWGPDASDAGNTPDSLPYGKAWVCDECLSKLPYEPSEDDGPLSTADNMALAGNQYHPNPLFNTSTKVEMPVWQTAYQHQSDFGLDVLEAVLAAGGLDPNYDSVESWLYDFYPVLDMRNDADLRRICSSPRFDRIAAGFQTIFKYDLHEQFDTPISGE